MAKVNGELGMEDKVFAESLRDALARAALTPSVLARELRVSRATVYKWLSGQLPSHKHARALQARLTVPSFGLSNVEAVPPSSLARRVPLIEGMPATGHPGTYVVDLTPKTWLQADIEFSTQAIGLRLADDCMEPEFYKGEIVIVDPQVQPHDGDYVIAELQEAQEAGCSLWTFKQYRARGYHRGQQVYDLVPLNPTYSTMTVGPDFPARVVGTMVEHRRRLRLRTSS
jgi:SOS-response transcriptional repressor LexA